MPARSKKPPERPLIGEGKMYKAVFVGSIPVDDGYGSEKVKLAAKSLRELGEPARKVWVTISDKSFTLRGRETHDPIAEVPLLNIITTSYLPDDLRPDGVSGTMFGFTEYSEVHRAYTVYMLTFKSSVRVTVPTVLKDHCDAAFKLNQILTHYDEYLQRAKTDASTDTDSKKGEILGRFPAKYLGSMPVADGDGVGSAAVNEAIQILRAKLAQMYASDRRKKRKKKAGGEKVVLAVSSEGIHTSEAMTNEDIGSVFIENIAYTSVTEMESGGAKKTEIFAYISEDERLNRTQCHIYDMPPGKAREVCLMIGAAFQVAEEENEEENPFAPTSASSTGQEGEDGFPGHLNEALLNRRRLTAVKVIGTGQFGLVYLANLAESEIAVGSDNERTCAVKMLRSGATLASKAEFLREASIMVDLSHQNICSIIGVSILQRPWLAVLEYVTYGDLRDVLRTLKEKSLELSTTEIVTMAAHISSAMVYVASKRYCHRDLASRNCLLGEDNIVKLADFGLSRPFDDGKNHYLMRQGARLPMKWTDPGGVLDKKFGEWTDVWSYGVTLWELFSHAVVPYEGVPNTEIQRRLNDGLRLSQPEGCPDDCYDIMRQCWLPVDKRIKFWEIDARLRARLKADMDRGVGVRDVGAVLNGKYTAMVRRLTRSASIMARRRSTAKGGGMREAAARARARSAKIEAANKNLAIASPGNSEATKDTAVAAATSTDTAVAEEATSAPAECTDVATTAPPVVIEESVPEEGDDGVLDFDNVLGSPQRRARPKSAVFEALHLSTTGGSDGGSGGGGGGERIRLMSVSPAKRPVSMHGRAPPPGEAAACTEGEHAAEGVTRTEVEVDMSTAAGGDLTTVELAVPTEGLVAHREAGRAENGELVVEDIGGTAQGHQGRVRAVSVGRRPSGATVTVTTDLLVPHGGNAVGAIGEGAPSAAGAADSGLTTTASPNDEAAPAQGAGDGTNSDTASTVVDSAPTVPDGRPQKPVVAPKPALKPKPTIKPKPTFSAQQKKAPPPVMQRTTSSRSRASVGSPAAAAAAAAAPAATSDAPDVTSPDSLTSDADHVLDDSESDDDDVDSEALPELSELGIDIVLRREKHERIERERQTFLRESYAVQAAEEEAVLAKIRAEVAREKEEERRAAEAAKDAVVAESSERMRDLSFSFSFNEKPEGRAEAVKAAPPNAADSRQSLA
mmetsp:Transcript_15213/g.45225  ORF Transcript_15213/g.45225 Transcript_15213/m.45225 type:complete len:1191 (-) Transcript_15213:908-4480(-)